MEACTEDAAARSHSRGTSDAFSFRCHGGTALASGDQQKPNHACCLRLHWRRHPTVYWSSGRRAFPLTELCAPPSQIMVCATRGSLIWNSSTSGRHLLGFVPSRPRRLQLRPRSQSTSAKFFLRAFGLLAQSRQPNIFQKPRESQKKPRQHHDRRRHHRHGGSPQRRGPARA